MNGLARTWRPLLSTALIVFIPLGVLTLIVFSTSGAFDFMDLVLNDPETLETLDGDEFFDVAGPFLWAAGIAVVLQVVASVYVYVASHRIIVSDLAGEPLDGPTARAEAATRFVPGLIAVALVVAVILLLLAVGLALWAIPLVVVGTPNAVSVLVAVVLLLAVLAPSIWVGVSFSMVTAVVAVENRGPIASLQRSFGLVRRRWWPTLGYLLLVGLIGSVAAQLIQIVAIPLAVVGDAATGVTIASLLGVITQGILIVGIGALYTSWYLDLRSRAETLTTDDLR